MRLNFNIPAITDAMRPGMRLGFMCVCMLICGPCADIGAQELGAMPAVADSAKGDSILDLSGLTFRQQENRAFQVGEHLTFDVVYGVLRAGKATMSVADTQMIHGRPCYHLVSTAKSHKVFDKLFKVRDRVESYFDMEGLFSWKYEKSIREGRYKADRFVTYDPHQKWIITRKDTLRVNDVVQDILSAFYYVRTLPLEIGKSFPVLSFSDEKVYPLEIRVHARDRIKVPAGKFDCIVIEPVLKGEGLFNQKGRIAIWVTDDERRIPVLMRSKVLVGSIDAELTSIQYLPSPSSTE